MPKDYVSRTRQGGGDKRKRPATRAVAPRHKPKQTRSQAQRRAAKRQSEKRNFIWKPVLILVVLVILIFGAWHFLREHAENTTSKGAPIVEATPVKIEKKSHADDGVLPNGPLKPVTFQFQPLQQEKASAKAAYILQLGTYASNDDKLSNLTSNLDGSDIQYRLNPFERAGQSMVRVEIGPFKLYSQAQQMQNQLLQQQIYTVIKETQ